MASLRVRWADGPDDVPAQGEALGRLQRIPGSTITETIEGGGAEAAGLQIDVTIGEVSRTEPRRTSWFLALLTEQCIGPLEGDHWRNGKSDSIDFYVEDAPQEFWDSKSDIQTIKSRHLNQFDLLLGLADPGAMAGFITVDNTAELVDYLRDFRGFTHPVYAYTVENFETMAQSTPITQVDSWA